MNSWIGMGRLTSSPEIRYTQGDNPMCVATYTLAINRRFKKDGEQDADFIRCIAFRKAGEFAEKYLNKGTKIVVRGRIQTGNYTNKDGVKVYTTDIVVEEQDFAESKSPQQNEQSQPKPENASGDGFMNIPDGLDEELPFN